MPRPRPYFSARSLFQASQRSPWAVPQPISASLSIWFGTASGPPKFAEADSVSAAAAGRAMKTAMNHRDITDRVSCTFYNEKTTGQVKRRLPGVLVAVSLLADFSSGRSEFLDIAGIKPPCGLHGNIAVNNREDPFRRGDVKSPF